MKKFLIWSVVIVVGIVGLYKYNYPTYSWHQKLTVEVKTPEGVKTGSAVTAIEWTKNFFSGGWGGASWHSKVRGEAVVVDLGAGKYLFALLRSSNDTEYIEHLATRSLYNETKRVWGKEPFRRVGNTNEPIVVPRKVYPLLVTFSDINAPMSVKKVAPDDLAATFGAGYSLKSITLEITDEPVTKGKVETVLGWINNLKKYRTNRDNPFTNTLPKEIGGLRSN